MIFSMTAIASEPLKNIEQVEEGYLLTNQQIIELANYIEELRAEIERKDAQLDAANELIKEYRKQIENYEQATNRTFFTRLGDGVTGAGIASLLVIISQGIN